MLRYLNSGVRDFGRLHISAHKRPNWEFYAVLKGRCGVYLEENPDLPVDESAKHPLRKSTIWVFPPNHCHGWYGEKGKPCEVASFHFSDVPPVLADAMADRCFLEQTISDHECTEIERLALTLEADYNRPTSLGNLRAERALLDLTLLILDDRAQPVLSTTDQMSIEKVEAAQTWFVANMRKRPNLGDVAAAIHVSPSHLRRLFLDARGETPHHALKRIRIEFATRLLAESSDTLESIADECGFSNASDLCRAFKSHRGCTPAQWRKRQPDYHTAILDWL